MTSTNKKNGLLRRIVLAEWIGFSLIVAVLWLNEVADLPHRFLGAPATPVNWRESLAETVLVLLLAALVTLLSRTIIARIKHLEGFLLVCAACKRICVENEWIPFDIFLRDHSDASVSHGLCPHCAEGLGRGIPRASA